jgi:hypothetical protein
MTVAVLGITCDAAFADGLPIPGLVVKHSGAATLSGGTHYLTKSTAARTTLRRIEWATRRVTGTTRIKGDYTIPGVAIDGTPGGLSANGRWLALIRPRRTFPQRATHLVVLDTRSLEVRRRLDLRGDYSFDAISPTGDRIYLIQYLSRADPTQYAVRGYDTRAGRMLTKPVVDPTEPDEQMHGYPITRVASPDGRWEYTLYSGSKVPFVHALDTARASARCIDLPKAVGNAYSDRLRISPNGRTLSVTDRHKGILAKVDAATFDVSKPGAKTPPDRAARGTDAAFPWVLIGLGAALAVGLASLWGMPRIRRRRLAGSG